MPGLPDGTNVAFDHVRLKRDQVLYDSGRSSRNLWVLRSGLLRVVQYSREGRRHVITVLRPGEIACFAMPSTDGLSVEAASDAVLCPVDRKLFSQRVASDSAFRRMIYRQQLVQLDRLHWLIWSIGALTPEERLAAFLAQATLYMPNRRDADGSTVLSIDLARSDIADLLSTSIETISRFTHRIEANGWIEIIDPAHFRILNLKAIAEMGQVPVDAVNPAVLSARPARVLAPATGRTKGLAKPGEPQARLAD